MGGGVRTNKKKGGGGGKNKMISEHASLIGLRCAMAYAYQSFAGKDTFMTPCMCHNSM